MGADRAILAADSDTRGATVLGRELDRSNDSADWAALVAALRRLRAGEDETVLASGLDSTDRLVLSRALNARRGKTTINYGSCSS
jgi:ribonuclease HI